MSDTQFLNLFNPVFTQLSLKLKTLSIDPSSISETLFSELFLESFKSTTTSKKESKINEQTMNKELEDEKNKIAYTPQVSEVSEVELKNYDRGTKCMWDKCDKRVNKPRTLSDNKVYCSRHNDIMIKRLSPILKEETSLSKVSSNVSSKVSVNTNDFEELLHPITNKVIPYNYKFYSN